MGLRICRFPRRIRAGGGLFDGFQVTLGFRLSLSPQRLHSFLFALSRTTSKVQSLSKPHVTEGFNKYKQLGQDFEVSYTLLYYYSIRYPDNLFVEVPILGSWQGTAWSVGRRVQAVKA